MFQDEKCYEKKNVEQDKWKRGVDGKFCQETILEKSNLVI